MDKENPIASKPMNEVDNIRKILFGDQISQVEERFNQVEKSIAQLRTENRNLRQALEAEVTQREQEIENLKNTVQAAFETRDDRWREHLGDQTDLVSLLQKALEQYQTKINLPK